MQGSRCGRGAYIVFVIVCFAWAATLRAQSEPLDFDIEEGDAILKLKEAAYQADVELLFALGIPSGIQTNAIKGRFAIGEALDLMLEGTPLKAAPVSGGEAFGIMNRAKKGGDDPERSQNEPTTIEQTETQMNLKDTSNKKKTRGLFKGLLALAVASAPDAIAQESGEQVYELSPFSVDASNDARYRATNTLAGTRIRSELKDVGASISVVTKEFLEDTGSKDAEDLLIYVAGAEVAGLGGNFGSGQQTAGGHTTESVDRSSSSPTRIRGLSGADQTRDYFLTAIPFDSYNTSRVTVSRGPNAVLFGLGSPGGVVENSLVKPSFKDSNNIELSYGRFGSTRMTFDLDRVLFGGKVGVRVAGLHDDEKFQQKPAFQRDDRIFGAFTWKLFDGDMSNTTLRGHVEIGESDSNRPRLSPPNGALETWWLNGKPTIDYRTDWRDQDRTVFSIPGAGITHLMAIYNEADAIAPGGAGVPEAFVALTSSPLMTDPVDPELQALLAAGGRGDYYASFRGVASFQDWAVGRNGYAGNIPIEEGGPFFVDKHITDPTVFDFYNKLLDGPLKSEYYDFEAYNVALEQQLFEGNLGFELAFDKQTFESGYWRAFSGDDAYNIQIDPNTHFPHGEPNPNFGRPYVNGVPFANENESERDSIRATAFARIDFREKLNDGFLGKFLGQHNVTGLFNKQTIDLNGLSFKANSPSVEYFQRHKNTSNIVDGLHAGLATLYYLGPSLADAPSLSGASLPNIQTTTHTPSSITARVWDPPTQQFVTTNVNTMSYLDGDRLGLVSGASKNRTEVDSTAFVWQGHFWENMLVGTVGWRKDESEAFTAPAPPRASDNHFLIDDPSFVLGSNPIGIAEKETWTYSGVLHLPRAINELFGNGTEVSLFYSESENFEPAAARFNAMGRALPSPTGVTEDKGILFSFLNGKLNAKLNWFETAQTNLTNSQIPVNNIIRDIDRQFYEANIRGINDDIPDQVAAFTLAPQEILDFYGWEVLDEGDNDPSNDTVVTRPQGNIAAVTNRLTEGFEFELSYNPTENWMIVFNASKAEASQTGIDEGVVELLALREPAWQAAPDINDPGNNFTLSEKSRDAFYKPWNVALLSDGTPVSELRKWRWNLVSNYQFKEESLLEGVNVGVAGRWQDKVAIGLPVAYSDVLEAYALDPSNPLYGDSEFNADAWIGYGRPLWDDRVDWKLQLNIRNLIGEKDIIPIAVSPNGTILNTRIPQGTIWELSSRFSF